MLKIRNFGQKSLNELYDQMRMSDLLPAHLDPNIEGDSIDDTEMDGDDDNAGDNN